MLPIWELHADLYVDRRWSGAEGFVFCSTLGTEVTCPRSRLCQKSMQIRDVNVPGSSEVFCQSLVDPELRNLIRLAVFRPGVTHLVCGLLKSSHKDGSVLLGILPTIHQEKKWFQDGEQ